MWALDPRFLVLVSASQLHDIKNLVVMQKLEARTVGLKPTQVGHVACGQAKYGL